MLRFSAILLVAGLLSCSSTDECDLAREQLNVDQTDSYGEACEGPFGYEGCKSGIDSCKEGDCRVLTKDSGQRICTRDCNSDSDCTGIGTCLEGFCQPKVVADCKTNCTSTECCTYANDPNDPAQCIQTGCTFN